MRPQIEGRYLFPMIHTDTAQPTVFTPHLLEKAGITKGGKLTPSPHIAITPDTPIFVKNSLLKTTLDETHDFLKEDDELPTNLYGVKSLTNAEGVALYYTEVTLPIGLEISNEAKPFKNFVQLPKAVCTITPSRGVNLVLDNQAVNLLAGDTNNDDLTLRETEGRISHDLGRFIIYRTHIEGNPLNKEFPYFFEFTIPHPFAEGSPFSVSLRIDLSSNDFSVINAEMEQLLNEKRLTEENVANIVRCKTIIESVNERDERIKAENAKIAGEAK